MQGFYVSMDYHNIAPDYIVDNYTVSPLHVIKYKCLPCPLYQARSVHVTSGLRSRPEQDHHGVFV